MMITHTVSLAILVNLVYAEHTDINISDYETEVVTEWSTSQHLDDTKTKQCTDDCQRVCVKPCSEAKLCKGTDKSCGKKDFPPVEHPFHIWPECIKDDICVSSDCECKYEYCLKLLTYVFS